MNSFFYFLFFCFRWIKNSKRENLSRFIVLAFLFIISFKKMPITKRSLHTTRHRRRRAGGGHVCTCCHVSDPESTCVFSKKEGDPATIMFDDFFGETKDVGHVGFCIFHRQHLKEEWRVKVQSGIYCTTPRCINGAHSGLVHLDTLKPLTWQEYLDLGFDIKKSSNLFPCVPSVLAFELCCGEPGGMISLLPNGNFLVRLPHEKAPICYIINRQLKRSDFFCCVEQAQ